MAHCPRLTRTKAQTIDPTRTALGASAPTIPRRVHTIRGPNVGTGTSSDHGSALMIARWWHCQHDTSSDRTPLARMLPSVTARSAR
jgi:hypothetical protein